MLDLSYLQNQRIKDNQYRPSIDYKLCDACGICIYECGVYVFEFIPDKETVVVKRPGDCVGCFYCDIRCPHQAITIKLL